MLRCEGLGCTNSLQTSFDLLGELCKFNRDVFQLLEDELRDNDSLAGRLLTVATNNLVDSNVFIRSVILSMERFKVEDARRRTAGQDYEAFDFANCKLWSFLESNRMRLLYDLMSIIQLEDGEEMNRCPYAAKMYNVLLLDVIDFGGIVFWILFDTTGADVVCNCFLCVRTIYSQSGEHLLPKYFACAVHLCSSSGRVT